MSARENTSTGVTKQITVLVNGRPRQVACWNANQAVLTYNDVVRLARGDVAIQELFTVTVHREPDFAGSLKPGNHMVVRAGDAFDVVAWSRE